MLVSFFIYFLFFFFFSSRRRHTRCLSDWSSDVCSSDLFIVRLTHTYFAMLSLAFGQIVYTIIFKWTSLTGGDNGLLNVWPPAFLQSQTAYYYFTLLVIGTCFLALHAIVNSPFGYALKAIRENPRRARFIGVNVRRHQL